MTFVEHVYQFIDSVIICSVRFKMSEWRYFILKEGGRSGKTFLLGTVLRVGSQNNLGKGKVLFRNVPEGAIEKLAWWCLIETLYVWEDLPSLYGNYI